MGYAVSAGTGLACLIAAVLMWTIGHRMMPRVIVIFVITGVTLLTTTWAGRQASGLVAAANRALDSVTVDLVDARISGLAAAVFAFIVGIQLKRKDINELTLVSAVLLPFAARSTNGGDLGNAIVNVLNGLTSVVGSLVSSVIN